PQKGLAMPLPSEVNRVHSPAFPPSPNNTRNLAVFPGAEGFGTSTAGGRGGNVIQVTNLNDSGPGSLRFAVDADAPRIVVFRVAGTIELKTSLVISNPFITIAGQTAPGSGITLRSASAEVEALIQIETHDVI